MGEKLIDYQKPDGNYRDYTSEPWEWLMARVRRELPAADDYRLLDYSVSIHEASHAVVNEHYRYKVQSVELQGTRGVTATEPTTVKPNHAVVVAHAGYVGQIQVVNKRHAFETANEDNLFIEAIFNREKYTKEKLTELYQECVDIVGLRWTDIQKVANALAIKGRLSGDELRDILAW